MKLFIHLSVKKSDYIDTEKIALRQAFIIFTELKSTCSRKKSWNFVIKYYFFTETLTLLQVIMKWLHLIATLLHVIDIITNDSDIITSDCYIITTCNCHEARRGSHIQHILGRGYIIPAYQDHTFKLIVINVCFWLRKQPNKS